MLRKGRKTLLVRDTGGFVARINMPGWLARWPDDHGYGPLAMVVESLLEPGCRIAMHEHRDDEIVSWVPDGVMRHDDRANGKLVVDGGHLMVMNAGRSFWHSEETLKTDPPLRMLQILIRPEEAGLEPGIQFGPLPERVQGQWRHLVGPELGEAPFFVRNSIDIFDTALAAGERVETPRITCRHCYLYQFSGSARIGDERLAESEQLLQLTDDPLVVEALSASVLVAFLINPNVAIARQGTVGDHHGIPRPAFVPFVRGLLSARELWRRWRARN